MRLRRRNAPMENAKHYLGRDGQANGWSLFGLHYAVDSVTPLLVDLDMNRLLR